MSYQITITDTVQTKSVAEELIVNTNELNSVKASIEFILTELNEYWEATQEDAQSFAAGLKDGTTALETICTCNKNFANAINAYVDAQAKTASNTVM